MQNDINEFIALRSSLQSERTAIVARLKEITHALDQSTPTISPASVPATTTIPASAPGKKRTFSAATKAKMAASQQARWAAKKSPAPTVAVPVAAPKKAKRVISPEAKARMIAGAKKRWAKAGK